MVLVRDPIAGLGRTDLALTGAPLGRLGQPAERECPHLLACHSIYQVDGC